MRLNRRRINIVAAIPLALIFAALLVNVGFADQDGPPSGQVVATQGPGTTPAPPPQPGSPGNSGGAVTTPAATTQPPPGGTPAPGSQPVPVPPPAPSEVNISHTLIVPASGLMEAVTNTFMSLTSRAAQQAVPRAEIQSGISRALFWVTEVGPDGLDGFPELKAGVYNGWKGVLTVAAILFPLSIAMNVLSVIGADYSAIQARAEFYEVLKKTFLTLVFGASSFAIMDLCIKLSWGICNLIFAIDVGEVTAAQFVPELIALTVTTLILTVLSLGPVALFIIVLIILFFMIVLIALVMGLSATTALLIMVTMISPLVIVLGSIPQFKWLYSTIMKLTTALLVLPAMNAMLLVIMQAITVVVKTNSGGFWEELLFFGVIVGCVGIMLLLNFQVAKLVFGPVMEALKMSGKMAGAAIATATAGIAALKHATALGQMGFSGAVGGGGGGFGDGAMPGGGDSPKGPAEGRGGGRPIPANGNNINKAAYHARQKAAAINTLRRMTSNPMVRQKLDAMAAEAGHQAFDLNRRAYEASKDTGGGGGINSVSPAHHAKQLFRGSQGVPRAVDAQAALAENPQFQRVSNMAESQIAAISNRFSLSRDAQANQLAKVGLPADRYAAAMIMSNPMIGEDEGSIRLAVAGALGVTRDRIGEKLEEFADHFSGVRHGDLESQQAMHRLYAGGLWATPNIETGDPLPPLILDAMDQVGGAVLSQGVAAGDREAVIRDLGNSLRNARESYASHPRLALDQWRGTFATDHLQKYQDILSAALDSVLGRTGQ